MNKTMEKFNYQEALIADYDHWCVVLRPEQVTLASLVLIEKSEALSYADVSEEAYIEQKMVIKDIEANIRRLFGADRFNYLMLMMTDPNPHFHVFPRYPENVVFSGQIFVDSGWPKAPDLAYNNEVWLEIKMELIAKLRDNWQKLS